MTQLKIVHRHVGLIPHGLRIDISLSLHTTLPFGSSEVGTIPITVSLKVSFYTDTLRYADSFQRFRID